MTDHESGRRKFMKNIGLATGAAILTSSAYANPFDTAKVKKLKPKQQEFMLRYGKWMDDFTEVVRLQKADPYNLETQERMKVLTTQAGEFKPELADHLKDKTFALIYMESIKRVKNEI